MFTDNRVYKVKQHFLVSEGEVCSHEVALNFRQVAVT